MWVPLVGPRTRLVRLIDQRSDRTTTWSVGVKGSGRGRVVKSDLRTSFVWRGRTMSEEPQGETG